MKSSAFFSLVIACYNESDVFDTSMPTIACVLKKNFKRFEIILVEDKSQDNTADLIRAYCKKNRFCRAVFHSQNRGRGAAVMTGIKKSRGNIVGFIDMDLEVSADYIPKAVSKIESGLDVVYGVRTPTDRSPLRNTMHYAYAAFVRMMLNVSFSDTNAGFKFFNAQKIKKLLPYLKESHWFWDTEVLLKSRLAGFAIASLPVDYKKNVSKKSTVKLFSDTRHFLSKLLAYRKQLPAIKKELEKIRLEPSQSRSKPVSKSRLPAVSIVVATYNNARTLRKTLRGLLTLTYPQPFEIIVINDGSRDQTRAMMQKEFARFKKIVFIDFKKNRGVCKARNAGIRAARYPIVINMDHDCIPKKDWLLEMAAGFDAPNVGVVSAYDYYGGTSTGFRRALLKKVRGYDEDYRYYREDTDLSFKIMDLGYKFKLVKAGYVHDHKEAVPQSAWKLIQHVFKRLAYHQNDVLLYKKHPTTICRDFLHVRFGFLVDPFFDFSVATGLWQKNGKFGLSSPRGIVFLQNKSPLHFLIIVLAGIGYVIAVKTARLIGSIRFKWLLL